MNKRYFAWVYHSVISNLIIVLISLLIIGITTTVQVVFWNTSLDKIEEGSNDGLSEVYKDDETDQNSIRIVDDNQKDMFTAFKIIVIACLSGVYFFLMNRLCSLSQEDIVLLHIYGINIYKIRICQYFEFAFYTLFSVSISIMILVFLRKMNLIVWIFFLNIVISVLELFLQEIKLRRLLNGNY